MYEKLLEKPSAFKLNLESNNRKEGREEEGELKYRYPAWVDNASLRRPIIKWKFLASSGIPFSELLVREAQRPLNNMGFKSGEEGIDGQMHMLGCLGDVRGSSGVHTVKIIVCLYKILKETKYSSL